MPHNFSLCLSSLLLLLLSSGPLAQAQPATDREATLLRLAGRAGVAAIVQPRDVARSAAISAGGLSQPGK